MSGVNVILMIISLSLGLGLIFLIFRPRRQSLVTGVAPSGPIQPKVKGCPKVGDYTILHEVGRGGMGTVFKGIGKQGITVAIKFIGGMGLDRRVGANGRNRVALVHRNTSYCRRDMRCAELRT